MLRPRGEAHGVKTIWIRDNGPTKVG
jgi:hypothetical protein